MKNHKLKRKIRKLRKNGGNPMDTLVKEIKFDKPSKKYVEIQGNMMNVH